MDGEAKEREAFRPYYLLIFSLVFLSAAYDQNDQTIACRKKKTCKILHAHRGEHAKARKM